MLSDRKSKTSSATTVNFNVSCPICCFKKFAKRCINNTNIVGDKRSPRQTSVETLIEENK